MTRKNTEPKFSWKIPGQRISMSTTYRMTMFERYQENGEDKRMVLDFSEPNTDAICFQTCIRYLLEFRDKHNGDINFRTITGLIEMRIWDSANDEPVYLPIPGAFEYVHAFVRQHAAPAPRDEDKIPWWKLPFVG